MNNRKKIHKNKHTKNAFAQSCEAFRSKEKKKYKRSKKSPDAWKYQQNKLVKYQKRNK
jgi:hypothetical protein